MEKSSSESDENNSSETLTSTLNISPSIGNFSKVIANLCGILLSKIGVFSIDKSLDSSKDHLQQLEETIINLSDDSIILTSLETSRVKLKNKQTDVELNKSDTTTSLSNQSKRRKLVCEWVQSPPLSRLRTIPEIIRSLLKFVRLFEVKVTFLTLRQSLRKEDINEMYQQEIYTNQFMVYLRDARQELKTIVARIKGQSTAASTDSN